MDINNFKVESEFKAWERFTKKSPIIFDGIIFIEKECLGKKWLVHPSIFSTNSLASAISLQESINIMIKNTALEKENYHDGYLTLYKEDEEGLLEYKAEQKSNPSIGDFIVNEILYSIKTLHPSDDSTGYIFRSTLLKLCEYGKNLIYESKTTNIEAPWLFRSEPIYSSPFDKSTGYFSKDYDISNMEKNMILELGKLLDRYLAESNLTTEKIYKAVRNDSHPLNNELEKLGLLSDKEKNQKLYYLQSWDEWELEKSGVSHFHNLRLLYILLFFQEEIKAQAQAKENEKGEQERLKQEEANRIIPVFNNDFNRNINSPIYYFEPWDKEKRYGIINEDYLKDLDRRVKELYDLKKKLPSSDEDSKASVTAKRRFLIVELEACGLTDEVQDDDDFNKAIHRLNLLGLQYLKDYYTNITLLLKYITSTERKEYCPDFFPRFQNYYDPDSKAAEEGSLLNSQISLEWFSDPKNKPESYEPNVWLAKCECLFKNSSYKDTPGILFSKIDGHRVKIVIEYDDGINLRMVSGELMA